MELTPDVFALAACLVAGHALGDFVLQTERMAAGKRRTALLAGHAALVLVAHLGALVPFFSLEAVAAAGVATIGHAVVDGIRVRLPGRTTRPLAHFLGDQAVHLVWLTGVWWALATRADPAAMLLVAPSAVSAVTTTGVVVAAVAFVGNGGSAVVRGVLASLDLEDVAGEGGGLEGSGRLIGILERWLGLMLALLGQWAALAVLVGAKSIARFEELRDRPFAEYYLVGTLTSLLVAVVVGLLVAALLP